MTCTSRSVRDAVAAEDRGIPAVVLCTEAVEETVASAAEAYRLPSLGRISITESLFGRSRDEIAQIAGTHVHDLVNVLSRGG